MTEFGFWKGFCASIGLVVVGTGLTGCLHVGVLESKVRAPGLVQVLFTVDDGLGRPVDGLEAAAFIVREDGARISPTESFTTVNPEGAGYDHHLLFLVDLSGSVREAGLATLEPMLSDLMSHLESLGASPAIGLYGFDGREQLIPIVPFGSDISSFDGALTRNGLSSSPDPSTNLYGAVVQALTLLRLQRSQRSGLGLSAQSLVIFTDGTDRAHRVSHQEALRAIDDEDEIDVFAAGLGGEVDRRALRQIGTAGFAWASSAAGIGRVLEDVVDALERTSRGRYALAYCSPSRAGRHRVRVQVNGRGAFGSLTLAFDAAGFGGGCSTELEPGSK